MTTISSKAGPAGSFGTNSEGEQTSQALWSHLRHELRTPLNAIIGYSEMLLEDAVDAASADLASDLKQVLAAGRQLLAIVNDLLDAQKLASDDVAFNLESLIANLDYQARAPLNGVIGYSEILLENAAEQEQEEIIPDLEKIHTAGNLFLARLNNIIDFSNLDAGLKSPAPGATDQSPLIDSVMASLRELAQESAAVTGGETGALLVVDDNEINRDLLSRYLARLGHTVQAAPDGRKALEMIDSGAFDLVLLDIMMPELNGYQVLQHLKDSSNWRDLPVIMISALDEMDSVVRCIELGAADYLSKPFNPVLLRARVGACLEKKRLRDLEKEQKRQLQELNAALDVRNRFIRQTFGRYLSDDIVETILEQPDGLKIGGEKRQATILMSDLRGFTSLSEGLPAEDVVSMVNIYLETMTDIILKYQGTIDEFIGDGILVIFGAPLQRPDDAQRAVACAVEMQLAMASVNDLNRQAGHPEVALGIGINTGPMVVGNIGSKKRMKYGVVGSNVNLTARIESYTVGGQIFISENTLKACGDIVRLDNAMQVSPKGVKEPLTIYEVGGIAGDYQLFLPPKPEVGWIELTQPLSLQFTLLEGKHAGEVRYQAAIIKLAPKMAEITAAMLPPRLSNLKLSLYDYNDRLISGNLYGKVLMHLADHPGVFQINFTAIPPEAETFLAESQSFTPAD
ncbi:MAG: response regulator [Deltaproteobacteria bacterium]|nr:response regulator [Deltaproteobacteria bacterium]